MNIKDLNGVDELSIKTNAGGVYSEKPITENICIENRKIIVQLYKNKRVTFFTQNRIPL